MIRTITVIIRILLSIWSVASRLLSGLSQARAQHGHSWSLLLIVIIIIKNLDDDDDGFQIKIIQIIKRARAQVIPGQ